MKKYRTFVCLFVVVGVGIIFLLTNVLAIYFLSIDADNIEAQVGVASFVVILIIIPTIMFLWTFVAFAPQITFDESGIKKRLCGIPLKKYEWNDIQDIKIITTSVGSQWLFLSKKYLGNHGIDYCRLNPKTIYLAVDDKKIEQIREFVPKDKAIRQHKNDWLQ